MKKTLLIAVAAAMLVALFAACPSAPAPAPTAAPAPAVKAPPFDIIQHKGTTLGIAMPPDWVPAAVEGARAVQKLPEYENDYVVVVDLTGESLEGVQLAADRMNAMTAFSSQVSTRVKDKFAGAQVGDKDKVETYFERVVKTLSETEFSGYTKASDWWVQIRWYSDDAKTQVQKDEYRYLFLFTIPREQLDLQIQKVLDGEGEIEPPKTEDEKKARERVAEALFEDGF